MIHKLKKLPLPSGFTGDDLIAAAVFGHLHRVGDIWLWNSESMNAIDVLDSLAGIRKDVYYFYSDEFVVLTKLTPSDLASKIDNLVTKAEKDPEFLKIMEEEAENELGMDMYLTFV